MQEDTPWSSPENSAESSKAGACLECSRTDREATGAGAEGAQQRRAGDGGRFVKVSALKLTWAAT